MAGSFLPSVLLAAGLLSAPIAAPAPATAAGLGPGPWRAPVAGAVVRGFAGPACPWCPGHRGVDYRVPPGAVVRAPGAGRVAWAGRIDGAGHVVILHPGGLRTSLSFLRRVSVRVGQVMGLGRPVGTAGAAGSGHDGSVVHFGLRIGTRYVDPLLLFRPPDLAAAVHLVDPAGAPEAGAARRDGYTLARFALRPGGHSITRPHPSTPVRPRTRGAQPCCVAAGRSANQGRIRWPSSP